MKMHFN